MVKPIQSPRVFISYAHESESHNESVFELSERLRSEGVDCHIDQYEVSPPEGWPRWSRNQIQDATFVLVVCTETYNRRFDGSEVAGTGAGAKWEGAIISQELYDSEGRNTKFIPIVFNAEDVKHIPVEMRGGTYYVLDRNDEYDDLYRHLTNQPKAVKRELGRLRSLPPKKRKEAFVGHATDTDKSLGASPTSAEQRLPLLMLWRVGGNAIFVRVERIRSAGKSIAVSIVPASSREATAVSELEHRRELIGLAYKETAMPVRMKSLEQVIEQGHEVWHLDFEIDENATRGGAFGEFNFSGFSAERIAEMRARRILLNEELAESVGRGVNHMTLQLIENSVAGAYNNNGFAVLGSPFPSLFEELKEDTNAFLEASRLSAVLLLILSNAVHTIDRLDLSMHSQTELAVRFEGTRPPRYSNEQPQIVRVKGICKLVEA